ncbi:MAG: hypothetical protein BWY76_03364 [bacterium ADurb.Bin429]|nr:MAG: hypothetical protein BWY76_03364 [bacterium ADurb.Bin429]
MNTYLRAINSYPGGDFSFSLPVTGISLAKRSLLHLDYNFEPAVRVNLYAKVQGTWFEFLLTGKEAQEPNVTSAGKTTVTADGRWHHLALDLGTAVIAALKAEGKPTVDLTLQDLVFANWETSSEARWYGFGVNAGHLSLCLDNVTLMPAIAGPASLSWSGPDADTTAWRTALDTSPWSIPTKVTEDRILNIQPTDGLRFLHVQVKDGDGKWGPVVHLPVPAKGK